MDAKGELEVSQEGVLIGSSGGETPIDEKKFDPEPVAENLLGLPKEETEKQPQQEQNLLDFSQEAFKDEAQKHESNLLDLHVFEDSAVIATETADSEANLFNPTKEIATIEGTTDLKNHDENILDLAGPVAPTVTTEEVTDAQKEETNLLDLPASDTADTQASPEAGQSNQAENMAAKEDTNDPKDHEENILDISAPVALTAAKEEVTASQKEESNLSDLLPATPADTLETSVISQTEASTKEDSQKLEEQKGSILDVAGPEPHTEAMEGGANERKEATNLFDVPEVTSAPAAPEPALVDQIMEDTHDPKEHNENILNLSDGVARTETKEVFADERKEEANRLELPEVRAAPSAPETILVHETEEMAATENENHGPKDHEANVANIADPVAPTEVKEEIYDPKEQEKNLHHLPDAAIAGIPSEPNGTAQPVSSESPAVAGDNGQATLPEQNAIETDEETVTKGEPESPSEKKVENAGQRKSSSDCENEVLIVELQSSLQEHMQEREEAEARARRAEERVRQCEEQLLRMSSLEEEIENLNSNIVDLASQKSNMEFEMTSLEQSRDEHERKAILLSSRLNAAKKKEGIKANLVEQLEDENKEIQEQFSMAQKELIMVTAEKESLEIEMEALKKKCVDRVKSAEGSLEEEHRLNEERKKKMKLYIETKAEELRVAKAHNDELQVEVEQTQISLRETNDRWKQLHAQWVQSQTRNRELQRDLNRIKKDSDHLHKIGDSLEMKLNRSAQETEEHKNKRLTAKHELMTILRTLEAERSVSEKLRDSIKFTFTPKALSQQQLLKESLEDFEAQLMKLSRRLGKPLPPSSSDSTHFQDDGSSAMPTSIETPDESGSGIGESDMDNDTTLGDGNSKRNRSEIDSNHLLSNLESETQRVSQCIMSLIANIERMHVMLDEGDRTCVTALTDLLIGVQANASSAQDETPSNARYRSV